MEHYRPADVCAVSPSSMLAHMLETCFTEPSFRVLLRESSRRQEEVRDEVRERIAGLMAIGLVVAIPFFGILSGSDFSLVEDSVAAEPITGGAVLEPPPVNVNAVLSRLETNQLTAADIRDVQTALKAKGFDPGPVDGIAGKRTLAALNAYRQSVHLSPVLAVSRESISVLQNP
jgi:hypothetical protein